jgi:DNA-binding NarL/FixJ family response regulator
MLTVGIIDRRDMMAYGISKILEGHPKITPIAICSSNKENIIKLVFEHQPEIIIVDVGYNGVDILSQVHKKMPETRFLTVTDQPKYSECCFVFKNGAGAYLSKEDITVGTIGETIILVADGKFVVSPLIIKQMFNGTCSVLDNLSANQLSQKLLSERETSILTLVAKGLSNSEIANNLEISVHTVRVHLRNIMEKMGAKNRLHAVYMALRNDYSVLTGLPDGLE